jgi:hypothetical protein
VVFSESSVSSTNKADRLDITEILLKKEALNITKQANNTVFVLIACRKK